MGKQQDFFKASDNYMVSPRAPKAAEITEFQNSSKKFNKVFRPAAKKTIPCHFQKNDIQ